MIRRAVDAVRARIAKSALHQRVVYGASWSVAGAVASRGLLFVALIITARILGPDEYGRLVLVQSTIAMFEALAGFGIGLTATKYLAELRTSDRSRAARVLALMNRAGLLAATAGALVALLLAPLLTAHVLDAPELASMLRIGALLLFFALLDGVQTGILAGLEAFRSVARINLATGVAGLAALVSGAYLGGVGGALWGLVAVAVIRGLLNFSAVQRERRRFGLAPEAQWRGEWRVLKDFSLPALLVGMMQLPTLWACSALLASLPDGYSQLAMWGIAYQWFAVLLFVPNVLGRAVLPVFSERLADRDFHRPGRLLTTLFKMNGLAVMPLFALGCIASIYVGNIYGAEYEGGRAPLSVAIVTGAFVGVVVPAGHLLAAAGQMWKGLAINFTWAMVFLTLAVILLPLGAFGVALAMLVAYLVHSAWTVVSARRHLQLAGVDAADQAGSQLAVRRSEG